MIFNASANSSNAEAIAAMLTEFMGEVNNTLTSFKSEVNTMLTGFTADIDADITALNTNVNTVKSNVTTVNTAVGTIPKAIVKSVQRGIVAAGKSINTYEELSVLSGYPRAYYIDVTISAVSNINKCFVYANVATNGSFGIPKLLNTTTLRLYINGGNGDYNYYLNNSAISWQVIEFY